MKKTCANCGWFEKDINPERQLGSCTVPVPLIMEWLRDDYGMSTVANRDAEECEYWKEKDVAK